MTDKEKLIELIGGTHYGIENCSTVGVNFQRGFIEKIANHLLANGVRLETKQATSDENKRIEELEAQLAEREKVVIQLRKQWQDSEMHICTMCGHFDHKTDGNIIYGNKTCGEICGYPFCKEKFTPWIPVSERLPEHEDAVLCFLKNGQQEILQLDKFENLWVGMQWTYKRHAVTHWMPLPEPPIKENT